MDEKKRLHVEYDIEALKRAMTMKDILASGEVAPYLERPVKGYIKCPNPAHNDEHASCYVYKYNVYCFSCGYKGDSIDVVGALLRLSYPEALEKLAEIVGMKREPVTRSEKIISESDLALIGIKTPCFPRNPVGVSLTSVSDEDSVFVVNAENVLFSGAPFSLETIRKSDKEVYRSFLSRKAEAARKKFRVLSESHFEGLTEKESIALSDEFKSRERQCEKILAVLKK